MPRPLLSLVAAAAVTAIAVGVGVGVAGSDGGDAPPPEPTPAAVTATPLAEFDTRTLAIARADFCDAVPPEAVERALGTVPTEATSYGNGEATRITPRVNDIAHEFACTWSAGPLTARAWVFAPPVTPAQAEELVVEAHRDDACRDLRDPPAFGSPTAGLVCATGKGRQVSFRGLFGDAWLACSLVGRDEEEALAERTGEWCVAVAQSAAAE